MITIPFRIKQYKMVCFVARCELLLSESAFGNFWKAYEPTSGGQGGYFLLFFFTVYCSELTESGQCHAIQLINALILLASLSSVQILNLNNILMVSTLQMANKHGHLSNGANGQKYLFLILKKTDSPLSDQMWPKKKTWTQEGTCCDWKLNALYRIYSTAI